ncbi:Sec-independent protein translocase protein TatB [Parachitinimonas caeni]|uniref:Sec-independent protein translocase protein TatB n=1 Tax=Parachitinimonas caeni TaxID=3031301 RepID=A0ABT7DSU8_9NEIS|nr:Sec-independent protein translocase protein TatB [Parachitinimonas caeni]MDK2123140.1 Sec-independent protein translocase protein TatB [Parachitinimonas caeni]
MFDFSFGEILVIGGVALIVIGPERLPKVAKTIGHIVGRAQRYVASVKADISREIELENLRKIEADMNEAGRNLTQNVEGTFHQVSASLTTPSLDTDSDEISRVNGDILLDSRETITRNSDSSSSARDRR